MAKTTSSPFLILFLLAAWTGAGGQGQKPLEGIVEDSAGEVVADAQVTLRGPTGEQKANTTTDEDGHFEFPSPATGHYVLEVRAPGFRVAEIPVEMGVKPPPSIRVRLEIAKTKQKVTVSAKVSAVPQAQQNTDYVELDQRLLQNLPIKEGDPLAVPFLFLEPAVLGAKGPTIIVDGVESSTLELPLSSIKQVYVNKSPYSAEFARPGKGRIEVITRRGSRHHYRGLLSLLLRNSDFDARNPFALVRPPLQRAVTEGQLSGPLSRHVTFFVAGRYFINNQSSVINAETPTGLLIENVRAPERNTHVYGRLDIGLNPTHKLTLAYKFKDKSKRDQNVGGFDLIERATNIFDRENEFKIFETATVSDYLLNDLRFTYKEQRLRTDSLVSQPALVVLDAFSTGGAQVTQWQRERIGNIQDTVGYVKGRHAVRFGGGARPRFLDAVNASNFGGTFTFSSLATFAIGQPFLFRINQGNPRVTYTQHEIFSFVEDEMRLGRHASLSLGARYEVQENLKAYHNVAPRLAFAYGPGTGHTVIRVGAGIFYDRLSDVMVQQSLLDNGERIREIDISNPSYPTPFTPSTPLQIAIPSVVRIAEGIQAPYLMQGSLSVERKLGSGRNTLTVDFTALRGLKLYRMRNINAPLPSTSQPPDPNFINIDQFESSGRSRTYTLTATFQAAVRPRFDLLTQYIFSHSLDDTSGMLSLPANNYDLRGEYGRSDFDKRHRLNLLGTYRLPLGLKTGIIVNLNSGIPFNITTGFDNDHDTVANDRPPGVDRNTGRGPGYFDFDAHLSKDIRLERNRAKPKMEVGIDAFNLLNHVNFKKFVGTLTSPYFGRANAAYPARELQLSLKFNF